VSNGQYAKKELIANHCSRSSHDSFPIWPSPSSLYPLCHYGSPTPISHTQPSLYDLYQPHLEQPDVARRHQIPTIVITSPPPPPSMEVDIQRQKQDVSMNDAVTRFIEGIQSQKLPPVIQDLKAMKPAPVVCTQVNLSNSRHSTKQLSWYSRSYTCLEIARVLNMAKEYVRAGESRLQIYLDKRVKARLDVDGLADVSGSEVDIRDSLEVRSVICSPLD
jgi:hypothetical protein